jgi:hypothetical protein
VQAALETALRREAAPVCYVCRRPIVGTTDVAIDAHLQACLQKLVAYSQENPRRKVRLRPSPAPYTAHHALHP